MSAFTVRDGQVEKIGIWVGDVIQDTRGRRFKVIKEKQVNWLIQDEQGKQYNLRIGSAGWTKAEDQEWAGPKEKTEYEKYLESVEAGITLGTVVNLTGPRLRKYAGDKYVCVALSNDGTFRLAKLGGDGGRYLKKIEASEVEVTSA